MTRYSQYRIAFGVVLVVAFVSAAGLLLRAEPPQAVGTWASIGATPDSRIGAAAVALSDGRTLIAGGSIQGTPTDTVVIFNPADGSFASAGQLLAPRVGHTATLLDDGRVLIVGGTVAGLLSADLELFNPSSEASVLGSEVSVFGGTMPQPRSGHAAARLADGKVLIAGGTTTDDVVLQTAEIYDPSTGFTTPTTLPMLVPRTGASATTLIDGRVLIAGGSSNGNADLASAEIYQPWSQLFEAVDTGMSVARSGHAAVLLPWNNSVLIAGGSSDGVAQLTSDLFLPAEFPDPYSYGIGHFGPTGSMAAPRVHATAAPHIEGYAVAMGGGAADAEVYRFATVKTDKDDYAPGVHALITGSGWEPNSEVTLLFQEDPAVHDDYVLPHVPTDSEGNFTWDQWAPEEHDLNVRFYLMAKQATPQGERRAQTTFTDARNFTLTFSGAGTGSVTLDTTTGIHSGTFKVPVLCGGTNASITSWTFTSTCTSISLNDNDATGTLTANPNGGSGFGGWSSLINFTGCTSTTSPCSFSVTGSSPAITATFNAGSVATTTAVASSLNPSTYGNSVTLTATVSSTSTPTGSVNFVIDAGSPVAGTAGATTATTATWTYTTSALNAGTHTVSASYVHSGSFQDSSGSLSGGQVVNKATPTATLAVNNSPQTYTGSGLAATVGIAVSSVPGTVANVLTGGAATQTTVGTYAVTANFVPTDTTNYNSLLGLSAGNFVIAKATPTATLAVSNSPQTYTGSGLAATVGITVSSVPGAVANVVTGGAATQTPAGTYAVTADFVPTDTANYNSLVGLAAGNFAIDKAASTTTTVGDGPFTYDTTTHSGGSGTVTGAGIITGSVTVTYSGDQINAGTYYVTAHYAGDANHFGSDGDPVGIDISKATSTTTTVGDGPFVYTGSTQTGGSGTVTGIGGLSTSATSLTYSGDQVNVGTYFVTAHYAGDANHFGSDGNPVGVDITKASSATTTVGAGPFVYTGSTQTGGSGTVTGAGVITGSATVTYSGDQVNVGTYFVTAHYAGDANHFGSDGAAVGIEITKASSATTTVGAGPFVYDTTTHSGGSGTVTGAGVITGSATVTYSGDQINAGTYYVTAHYAGDANHFGSDGDSVGIDISKATSTTTTVGDGPFVYTGSTQTGGSGTVTGIGGLSTSATSLTYSGDQVNVGTYYVTAHYAGDANHFGSDGDPVGIDISKAASTTTTVGDGPFVYTGSTQTGGSGTVTGIGGLSTSATSLTYSGDQVNVGTYFVTAHYAGDANHFGSDGNPVGIDITKASSATTTVGAGPFVYTGSTQTGGSGTVTGAGVITGSATVTYSGDQVNVGTYSVTAHYAGDANHFGSDGAAVGIEITKASSATTTVGAGPFVYDTTTHSGGSGTVTGAGVITGSATVTYSGDQINAGTYYVTAHYAGDANHFGSDGDSVGIDISKATSTTTTVGDGPFVYTGSTQTGGSGTVTGIGGLSTSATSLTYSGDQVNVGTYYVTAHYAGDANHFGSDGDPVGIDISKAASTTTTVGDGPFVYTGSTQTGGSGTVTGIGGLSTSATSLTYSGDQVNVGTYFVTAHYAGDANHFGSDGNPVGIDITKASSATTTVGAGPFVYTGSTQTGGSGTVTGAGVITGSATVTYSGDQVNVGTYSVTAHYAGDANHFGSDGAAVGIEITKASSATTTVGAGPLVYDTTTHSGGSGTVTGAGVITGSATVTYSGDQVNAGTYYVTAHYAGDANHDPSDGAAVGIVIQKASSATTTVGDGLFTYDGTTHTGGSGTVTGAGSLSTSATSLTYTGDQVNAGTYYVTAHYAGDTNHNPSDGAAVGIVIQKANATVVVTPYTVTYDTFAHTATVTSITGVNSETGATVGAVTLNTTHTAAGTYNTDSWSFAGTANYNNIASTTITDTINKATATVVVSPYSVQWDGNPHTATHTITGVNGQTGATVGTVTLNTTHTDIGTYNTDSWSFTPIANYNTVAGATITDVISTAYCFNGFLSPIGGSVETSNGGSFLNPVRAFKLGSTIPIKFLLNSLNGSTCGAVVTTGIHTLQAIYYSSAVDFDPAIDASPTDAATTGNQFRLTSPEWHFNLSTKGGGFKAGTWLLKATLQDGSVHTVWITIKK